MNQQKTQKVEYRVAIPPYVNSSESEGRFWVLQDGTRVSKGDKKKHTFDPSKYETKNFVHSVPKFSSNILKDGMTLSKYMKKRLDAPGYFYTICPKNYLYDDLQILTESILWQKPQFSYLDILIMFSAEINKFLKEDKSNICIIEKRVSQDNENSNKYFKYKNETYVILSGTDSENDILQALEAHTNREGEGVMVLGNIEKVSKYLQNRQITDEKFFDELSKYSFRLYYPIYDNESFMVLETPALLRLYNRLHINPTDVDKIIVRQWELDLRTVSAMPLPDVLIIERDISPDPGFMLYRYTKSGTFAGDTWHENLEDAKHQAEFEYGNTLGEWQEVPEDVQDTLPYVLKLSEKN